MLLTDHKAITEELAERFMREAMVMACAAYGWRLDEAMKALQYRHENPGPACMFSDAIYSLMRDSMAVLKRYEPEYDPARLFPVAIPVDLG